MGDSRIDDATIALFVWEKWVQVCHWARTGLDQYVGVGHELIPAIVQNIGDDIRHRAGMAINTLEDYGEIIFVGIFRSINAVADYLPNVPENEQIPDINGLLIIIII